MNQIIKAERITNELFKPFGVFHNVEGNNGYPLTGNGFKFYPDRVVADSTTRIGFSILTVKKSIPRLIDTVEFHKTTWEILIPLNDEAIIHVSPPSGGKLIKSEIRAFIIPKLTIVKINTGVLHLAPLPVKKNELTALIILPEGTYMNDCSVTKLAKNESFEIII